MKYFSLILLLLLSSCAFVSHSPDENSIIYEQNPEPSIILKYSFKKEKYDYSSWKLLYDMDRGYIYDEWMKPYGSPCSFGNFKVYRWVGLPKVHDTLEECMKEKKLLF